MLSRMQQSTESAHGFVGGCLNAAYIAGFLRNREQDENGARFVVQQTNNVVHALPVVVKGRFSLPAEKDPVKVIGHLVGHHRPDGERVVTVEALQIDRPSLREMPNHAAWQRDTPPEGSPQASDDFRPFFDPNDNEEIRSIFYGGATMRGRPCLNVVRVAGFIDAFGFARKPDGTLNKGCIVIALRQLRDPNTALPVRLYGRFAEAFLKNLTVGKPIFVEGFYRVRYAETSNGDNGSGNREPLPYIWCQNIKVATRGEIQVEPDWWKELLEKRKAEMKERAETPLGDIPPAGLSPEIAQVDGL